MYSPAPFVASHPRAPGFHDVRCRATWTPAGAEPSLRRIVVGDYLDADSPCGTVTLGCGIEALLSDLRIDFVDYDHLVTVCELVSRQLAERPWATLRCPLGAARIELVPR